MANLLNRTSYNGDWRYEQKMSLKQSLKQLLEETDVFNEHRYSKEDYRKKVNGAIETWLTQKRQVVQFGAYLTDLQIAYQTQVIDELLEELKQ